MIENDHGGGDLLGEFAGEVPERHERDVSI